MSADAMASNSVNTPDVQQPSLRQVIWQVKRNQSPYAILGLQPECTERDVATAFRKLALLLHPDKCTNEKQKELHTHLFIKIDEAKDAILNPTVLYQGEGGEEVSMPPTKSPWNNPMFRKKAGRRGKGFNRWEPRADGCYHWVPRPNKYRYKEDSDDEAIETADASDDEWVWDSPKKSVAESQSESDGPDDEASEVAESQSSQDDASGSKQTQVEDAEDEDEHDAESSDSDSDEEEEPTNSLKVRDNLWITPSGKQKKNLGRGELVHASRPIANAWAEYHAARSKAHQRWAWNQEKQTFNNSNALASIYYAGWWEEDGPAMFAEEEAELAVEHEDILEEHEIPTSVPFNLGDFLPDL
ncbi:hypothetical protein CKM354_000825000 [Cercospora kikuchii]|uniref:J domain-containing protein n=1 Tax=Cercospora kikuchii TaxID=84275 RepID=A0A9P3CMI0_9PEZI|nr:uncharacterized protein CKM354_000825000 [Cercospora kikuchii]GIZ45066.1 hypothetical protein CKM354_000825000 [Cercospora kikuchii]